MELYFSPLACSLATRIALYEAAADATYTEVDPKTKLTSAGQDFHAINPLALVPVLRTDAGDVLTENAAILQYVADHYREAGLAPRDGLARARLQQWLCFIGTELHKGFFVPLLDKQAPEAVKEYARAKGPTRLAVLDRHLQGRAFLLDHFSVADAYLCAVLNWASVTAVKLADWPAVAAYQARLHERPSIARALAEEFALYKQRTRLK
jgi:glutathione S-transferase